MIQTEDGITTPSGGDEQKLVQDLAAMAVTIQEALNKRANLFKGTSTERAQFTLDAQEGQLWKDTNGTKGLYAKQGTGWTSVWPDDRTMISLGSRTQEVSPTGQLQLRRYYSSTGNDAHANLLMDANESFGFSVANWKNGEVTGIFRVGHDGQLHMQTNVGGVRNRPLPFAVATGRVSVTPPSANTSFTVPITFPTGRFTAAPTINLNNVSINPQRIAVGAVNITTSGFDLIVHKTNTSTHTVHWHAIQMLATGDTDPDVAG